MKKAFLFAALISGVIIIMGFVINEQSNSIPSVSLKQPSGNNPLQQDATIKYTIRVEDKEDGSSAYEEIVSNEVFLKLKFLPDSAMVSKYLEKQKRADAILAIMKQDICFNCHSVKQKLIGPSFESVAKKYGAGKDVAEKLSASIINGSKGTWGASQPMPSHPDIKKEDAVAIAEWVLQYGADEDFDLLPGLEGSFKTHSGNVKQPKAVYVLIPSYRDHGLNGLDRKEGKQVVVIPLAH
ncbi:c-type cytochrome [Flavihumibacter profundi]|uniref:c-type cytochrome n=1 Tax=Flavihumibacter profundi TaxID=2716883 RepID=UPI001CC5BBC7|nr:c-type cytochrome [Flavihumibacter profundi]MBZ5858700.1 hypothetical protein [Flavihumibacter profundi]